MTSCQFPVWDFLCLFPGLTKDAIRELQVLFYDPEPTLCGPRVVHFGKDDFGEDPKESGS